jgi:hypothetical protein
MSEDFRAVALLLIANSAIVIAFLGGINKFLLESYSDRLESARFLFQEAQKREAEFYLELWPVVNSVRGVCLRSLRSLQPKYLPPEEHRRKEFSDEILASLMDLAGRVDDIRPFIPQEVIEAFEEFYSAVSKNWMAVGAPTLVKVTGGPPSDDVLLAAAKKVEDAIRRRIKT